VSGSGVVDAHPARPADGRVRIRQRQSEPPGVAARVSCDLVAIGPWPPLIVGQSIATAALVGHLERGGIRSVQSIRNLCGKWAQRLSRVPRYVWALFALAAARKAPWAYYEVPLYGRAKDRFYNDTRVEELGRRHDRVTTIRLRRISQGAR
jgi:hypothetical protein